jgi:predicted RNA binding protein YcfA (HicA-like mRNA interferase family)
MLGVDKLSKLEKLLERIRNNPKTVRFEELDKILRKAGFVRRQSRKGTSHYVYTKDGADSVTVPFRTPYVLVVYVEEAMEAIGDFFDQEDEQN